MKYKNLFLVFVTLLLIFKASLCLADGMFMSSEQFNLYSPEQKAIIAWDGKTEQMILASKVQTDKISNKEFSLCVIEKVKLNFQQMGKVVQTIAPDPHFLSTYIFSIDNHWTVTFADFERLDKFYFFIRYNNQAVLTDDFPRTQGRDMMGAKFLSPDIGEKAQQYADMVRAVLNKELTFKKEWINKSKR